MGNLGDPKSYRRCSENNESIRKMAAFGRKGLGSATFALGRNEARNRQVFEEHDSRAIEIWSAPRRLSQAPSRPGLNANSIVHTRRRVPEGLIGLNASPDALNGRKLFVEIRRCLWRSCCNYSGRHYYDNRLVVNKMSAGLSLTESNNEEEDVVKLTGPLKAPWLQLSFVRNVISHKRGDHSC